MIDIEHKGKKDLYNFGLLDGAESPDKKIPFASKKWMTEIYAEMKNKAHLEFKSICEMLKTAVANSQDVEDDW